MKIVSNSVVTCFLAPRDTIEINAENMSGRERRKAVQFDAVSFYSRGMKPVALGSAQPPA
jgi:hypothetical protein